MKFIKSVLLPAALLVLASCGAGEETGGHEGHGHEEHTVSVTRWEGGFELFAEFHPPVRGAETVFTVFLTRLEDFRPAAEGRVAVVLRDGGRIAASATAERADKPGVWTVTVPSVEPGEYDIAVSYNGGGSAVFEPGAVTAFETEDEAEQAGESAFHAAEEDGHDHAHDHGLGGVDDHIHAEDGSHIDDELDRHPAEAGHGHSHGGDAETVSFLKEQQWNTDFMVGTTRRVMMRGSLPTVAEVIPQQSGYAEIVSPVGGYLRIDHNATMAVPGRQVREGDNLIVICPPLEGTGSWVERRFAYDRARKEFERAERLIAREAISQREYDEIRNKWLVEKASFETVLQGVTVETAAEEGGEVHLALNSPISGIVASVSVMPGQTVEAGQRLMTIVDPGTVWLRADMFEKDYYRMGAPMGARLAIPGAEAPVIIEPEDLMLLSRGGMFDRESMTIPVIFEIDNSDGMLKIGQTVQMEIFTGKETSAVAIPEQSIIDEDYARYVFVQHGGESFEKRAVKTGARSGGLVEIVEGLNAGERVVTRGAYAVKLASSKSETGAAHVH
jgi:RND family efflux transporter MFP subunit